MKKIIIPTMFVCALLAVSCGKEKQCQCQTVDIVDDGLQKLLTIDGGLSCDDITVMGYEEKYVSDEGEKLLKHTEMHTVKCREFGN